MSPVDRIAQLFAEEGAGDYLGEEVTMSEHMRQAGGLARADGAPDALVAAALLHDVGHICGDISGLDLMTGTDNRHGNSGAAWAGQWFGPEVCEPIRLHVDAKRYLCAVDPGYRAVLSPASVYTLKVQGGPMSAEEVEAFRAEPHADDAVAVRRWDDCAKDPSAPMPPFEEFRELLQRLVRVA